LPLPPPRQRRIAPWRSGKGCDQGDAVAVGQEPGSHGRQTTIDLGRPNAVGKFIRLVELEHDNASVDAKREKRKVLSSWVDVDLPTSQTYAVRLVVSNPYARVSSIAVPEDTAYLGSQIARCEIASNAAYCCPAEMEKRIELGNAKSDVGHPWTSAHLREPTCIAGGDRDEVVSLGGKIPHFLTLGRGTDKVRVLTPGSVVLLGGGDDLFEADMKAMVNVRGGRGNDVLKGSELADFVDGGDGNDKVFTFGGNDVIHLGAGDDYADAGQGDDVIYPGSGNNNVNAGEGDDDVVYLHVCELDGGAKVSGGDGSDRLILPTTKTEAVRLGLRFDGFETIVEGSTRASLFADCEQ
jgi:RTX calcium-binding nonapeptide repeat (4 copies)